MEVCVLRIKFAHVVQEVAPVWAEIEPGGSKQGISSASPAGKVSHGETPESLLLLLLLHSKAFSSGECVYVR